MQLKFIVYSALSISLAMAEPNAIATKTKEQIVKKVGDKFEKAKNSVTPTAQHIQSTKPAAQNINMQATKKKLTIAEATLKAINAERLKNKACAKATKQLKWNPTLYYYAKEHSIDMVVSGKLSHDGSGTKTDKTAIKLKLNRGSHFYERVNQKANSKDILSGELIVRNKVELLKGPKELISYWIKNPKDCKVIMDSRFTDVALAKVVSNKDNKAYWTLLLAGARGKK